MQARCFGYYQETSRIYEITEKILCLSVDQNDNHSIASRTEVKMTLVTEPLASD